MTTNRRVYAKVWYLLVLSPLKYDYINECLFFNGQETDITGQAVEEEKQFIFVVPPSLLQKIAPENWLKMTDFYLDFNEEEKKTKANQEIPEESEEKHLLVGLKIDGYNEAKNQWDYIYEKIVKVAEE